MLESSPCFGILLRLPAIGCNLSVVPVDIESVDDEILPVASNE